MSDVYSNLGYPDERKLYAYHVGDTAETIVKETLLENTINVLPHDVHDNGADIALNGLSVGAEIWNWRAPHCYNARTNSVIKNLKEYQYRTLVCSFTNSNTERRMKEEQTELVTLGFQILPAEYLESFKGHVRKGVKFDNRRTRKMVRNRLKPLTDKIKSLVLSKSNPNMANNEPDTPYVYSSINNCSNTENNDIKHTKNTLGKMNSQQTVSPIDVLLPVFDENTKETLNVNRHHSDGFAFISICIATNCSRFYAKIKNWILRAIRKALEV